MLNMAYLRTNRTLLMAFGAFVTMLVGFGAVTSAMDAGPWASQVGGTLSLLGLIVWPWALIKPSTLRARLRRQGPVVLYLVGFFCAVPLMNDTLATLYVAIGGIWFVVYLVLNASPDAKRDTSVQDSLILYDEYLPIQLGRR